jgi:hypothetical protein
VPKDVHQIIIRLFSNALELVIHPEGLYFYVLRENWFQQVSQRGNIPLTVEKLI